MSEKLASWIVLSMLAAIASITAFELDNQNSKDRQQDYRICQLEKASVVVVDNC